MKCLARGSRHQGECQGGGAQCTFAALVFLCWETSCHLTIQDSETLNHIVQDGTDLYLSNHTTASVDIF